MRTRLIVFVAWLAAALAPAGASAATPATGGVSEASPTTSWQGGPFVESNPAAICAGDSSPGCDTFSLSIAPPSGSFTVEIAIGDSGPNDGYDLYVYDSEGTRVGSSTSEGGNESVTLVNPRAGTFRVQTVAWKVDPGSTYSGRAALSLDPEIVQDPESVLWNYDAGAPQASAEVPLRVVSSASSLASSTRRSS